MCAPLVTPLCSQSDHVAHPRTQVGQDMSSRRLRDHHLLVPAVFGVVRQPVGADLSLGLLPPQGEGGLRGVDLFEVSRWVDI